MNKPSLLFRTFGFVFVAAAVMVSFVNVINPASVLLFLPCHEFDNDQSHIAVTASSSADDTGHRLQGPSEAISSATSDSHNLAESTHYVTMPSIVRGETIIVGMSNRAYFDVAVLWYQRMTDLGYQNHLILAADQSTARMCEEAGMRYDWLGNVTNAVIPACDTDSNKNMVADVWRKKMLMFAARWMYVRQKLIEGYHVLLSDVDSVYNDRLDIKRVFEDGEYDHYASYANKMPANVFQQTGYTICGCFNWMRSSPSMIHFLDLLLRNCGCTTEKNNGQTCKCGCDDQVAMNSMMFYQLDMVWDEYRGEMDSNNEFLQNSMTGVSLKTGQRIQILDRNFVYRGHKNNACPGGNFVTFPKGEDSEPKLEQMKMLERNCPLNKTISQGGGVLKGKPQ